MQKKKVILSLPILWVKKLEETRKQNQYTSLQEVIYETLRNRYFTTKTRPAGKRAKRGPKIFEDYFSLPTKKTKALQRGGYL